MMYLINFRNMKAFIPKIVSVFILSLFLTGCFSIKEETTIQTTGAFTSEIRLDLSQFEEMGNQFDNSLKSNDSEVEFKVEKEVKAEEEVSSQFTCENAQEKLEERGDNATLVSCEETAPNVVNLKIEGQKKADDFSYENGVFSIKVESTNGSDEASGQSQNSMPKEMIQMMGMTYDQIFIFPSKVMKSNYGKIEENSVKLDIFEIMNLEAKKERLEVQIEVGETGVKEVETEDQPVEIQNFEVESEEIVAEKVLENSFVDIVEEKFVLDDFQEEALLNDEDEFFSSAPESVKNISIDASTLLEKGFVVLKWDPLADVRNDISDQVLYTREDDSEWDEGYSIGKYINEVELEVDQNKNYEVKILTLDMDGNVLEKAVISFPTQLVSTGFGTVISFIFAFMIVVCFYIRTRRLEMF